MSQPNMTMDEALAFIEASPEHRMTILQVLEEERALENYDLVLLELKHKNAMGFTFNKIQEERDRLYKRKQKREQVRREILEQYRAQKGAS